MAKRGGPSLSVKMILTTTVLIVVTVVGSGVLNVMNVRRVFDTTTKLHATRIALRMERGKREEIYSYADLQELATRVGVFLVGESVGAADRVILYAKNAPEWAMAYFGILKAGATAAPLDSGLSPSPPPVIRLMMLGQTPPMKRTDVVTQTA